MRVFILDSTLHDGAQTSTVSFSLDDKLAIARRLDDFGIDYIDAGWPAVDPRDRVFFERARDLKLKHARLTAFGYIDNDASIQVLLKEDSAPFINGLYEKVMPFAAPCCAI